MITQLKWIAACVLLAIPFSGLAQELSYTYLQARYIDVELDEFDADADGYALDLSAQVHDNAYLFATYADVESDRFSLLGVSGRADQETIAAGLGFRAPLASGTDLNASIAYIDSETDASASGPLGSASTGEDDEGYGASVGLRHLFTPQLEGNVSANYVDIYDDDTTSVSLAALFHVTSILSLRAGYAFGDDADVWSAGVRVGF